jgi:hypothetical protein
MIVLILLSWGCMSEMATPGRENVGAARMPARPLRRRRRLELRTVATALAVFVAVAWTIVFAVGLVLR